MRCRWHAQMLTSMLPALNTDGKPGRLCSWLNRLAWMALRHTVTVLISSQSPVLIIACSYCILGDGCMMEGISNEACSLAGHWGLGKLIALYDDNKISIDGNTDIAFTEDVAKRYEVRRAAGSWSWSEDDVQQYNSRG